MLKFEEIDDDNFEPSDGFEDPHSPPTLSTELENTDTFDEQDIMDLGFLRSNPTRKIYQYSKDPTISLEIIYEYDRSVKDGVVRRILVEQDVSLPLFARVLYNSTKPIKEDIAKIL